MGEITLTNEQMAAVSERNRTLLVTAAAGAGKTATLTARIIASLTDKTSPADISRCLVVTFTRAAAAELQARIKAAVEKALSEDPQNKHLARQLLLLPSAEIKTIDSFCNDLLKEGASLLGISPGYRIADPTENALLADECLNQLIDDAYDGIFTFSDNSDFALFAEELTGVKSEDSLSKELYTVYNCLSSFPEGVERLQSYIVDNTAESEPFRLPAGQVLRERLLAFIEHYEKALSQCKMRIPDSKYVDSLDADLSILHSVSVPVREYRYQEAKLAAQSPSFVRLATITENKRTEDECSAHYVIDNFKKEFTEIAKEYFAFAPEEFSEAHKRTNAYTRRLYEFLSAFDKRFTAEKRRRGICSYNDLEHGALRLLWEKDGTRTPFCESLADSYDYIYIDEYQDVSPLQHAIFSALTRQNCFMVGDVKQSIYAFRDADSSIFTRMKTDFAPLASAAPHEDAVLFMPQNFRSDRAVIDFCNAVFNRLFDVAGKSIGYLPIDALVHKKKDAGPGNPVQLIFMPNETNTKKVEYEEDDVPIDKAAATDKEVLAVVTEITRLLSSGVLDNGERVKPSDIVILLRDIKRQGEIFATALRSAKIPAVTQESPDFFLNPEILLILSLLRVIDNPRHDIPLCGVLRSPIYRLSMDELVTIRKEFSSESCLYDACISYNHAHNDAKITFFLNELAFFRHMAESEKVDCLIRTIYRKTGIMALTDNGINRAGARKNLLLLHHFAKQFESSSYRGLYRFISYVNELVDRKEKLPVEDSGIKPEAVRIMTVHRAKGLEAPICFLCRAGSDVLKENLLTKSSLIFHKDLGIATRFRDETGIAVYENPVRRALIYQTLSDRAEEELRVLYVALTRAEERLYITGKISKAVKESIPYGKDYLSRYTVMTNKCYAPIITAALKEASPSYVMTVLDASIPPAENGENQLHSVTDAPLPAEAPSEMSVSSPQDVQDAEDSPLTRELRRRFAFSYPYLEISRLPGKLTVSKLYPTVLDTEDETPIPEEKNKIALPEQQPIPIPRFYADAPSKADASPAARGTATHLFMQFCDIKALKTSTAEEEIQRLTAGKFIDKADADIIFTEEAEAFRHSSLFRELCESDRVYRELRFHAQFPADAFTADEEKKKWLVGEKLLVQGVIDCIYFRKDGSYVLVDYKTDRLTPEEKADRTLAEKKLCERHTEQLSYYAEAANRIFGCPPSEILIYSLPLADTVPVKKSPLSSFGMIP